ncbi:MAG: hypothetical protein ACRDTC_17705 [Pseudonocardiaceae bacterium]
MSSVSSLVVSLDELRAVHRLTGACLPRFVVADDEEDPRVDAAAVRGLAARELVDLRPDQGVLLADPLARLLAPCHAARWIAEIDIEVSRAWDRHAVIVGASGTAVVATELAGGLVSLRLTETDPLNEMRELCRLDEVSDEITAPAAATGLAVPAEAHRRADELLLRGAATAATAVLTAAGVPAPTAQSWITAVSGRRCAVAVTVARNHGDGPDGPFEVDEVRWLVAGDGTAWRVRADEPPEHDGDPSPGDALSVLTPAGRGELPSALELITAE